jgi:hypothetical protein
MRKLTVKAAMILLLGALTALAVSPGESRAATYTCSASTTCSNGTTLRCNSVDPNCFGVYHCYVYCDQQWRWCPGASPSGNCPI